MSGPIFIVGSPRSGTTLLRAMLNRHPDIGLCDETYYFFYVFRRQRAFGDLRDEKRRRFLVERYLETDRIRRLGLDRDRLEARLMAAGTDYAALFRALLDFYAESSGKRRCGEKTPQHAFESETLCRLYPDARIVHLVRDPRDVVASLRRMPWGSRSPTRNARLWRTCVAAAERRDGAENFLRIRYEDLVDQPEAQLRRVCGFLGEDYTPAMLEAPAGAKSDKWWFQRAQGPLSRDRQERWRQELRGDEVALVEWIAGRWLKELGYEPSGPSPGTARRLTAAARDALEGLARRLRSLPQLYYHWVRPTQLAVEERWIDR